MADADNGLGPWADADLAKTARMDAGTGADDGLPMIVRFVSNIAKLIRRRIAQPNSKKDPNLPGIFLLQPVPPSLGPGAMTKRVPMLDNGLTPVAGRIWFVGAVPASGHYIDLEAPDDDAMFTLITDEFGQGTIPAIIFDPRPPLPEARYYPNGLDDLNVYKSISITSTEVTLSQVVAAIEKVYESCLVTPGAQPKNGKLWHNTDNWWPSSKAESLIQLYIKAGLAGAFATCTIRHEQPMPQGRLDLEIEESDPLDPSKVTRHAIIELKVLRSFHESGKTFDATETKNLVKSGVTQVSSYSKGMPAKWLALCCFDMRNADTGEACFKPVRKLAKDLKVHLKRWFLYAKSEYLRDALASSG